MPIESMETQSDVRQSNESPRLGSTIFSTTSKAKHMAKRYREIKQLAPVVPDTFHTILLTIVMFVPTFLFLLGFTAMGYGLDVYNFLKDSSDAGSGAIYITIFILFGMYMLDSEYWDASFSRGLNIFRQILIMVATAGAVIGIVFRVEDYSYGPLCVFLVLMVVFIVNVKTLVVGAETSNRQYVGSLPVPLLVNAIWALVWWAIWTNQTPEANNDGGYRIWSPTDKTGMYAAWEPSTKAEYATRMGCVKEFDDDSLDDQYPSCGYAFLLWASPGCVSLAFAVFALTTYVLDPHDTHNAPKMVGQILLLLLFGMWCSASISGAGSIITEALFAFILAGMVGVCGFVCQAYGTEMFKHPDEQPFVKRMQEKYGGMADPLRGLLIVTSSPLILGYFALSFVNQVFRQLPCLPITKVLDESDKHLWLTKTGAGLYDAMTHWKWTTVLVYALYWGVFFFSCNVLISKFTVLFLSVLIEWVASMSLGVVSVIFLIVGFIMFMLPPVPGVPVYLSSGIILVAAGEETLGIAGSIIYAFIFCMVLKLTAVLGQMYLFGVPLGKYVSVRRTVGVNSQLVRCMKLVLAEPGISVSKVTILTGGPDWPTSVMCGILGLNPIGVILGTLPVGLLILPTILAGSYFYLSAVSPEYAVLATVFAAVAALVQSGSMFVAAYYLDKAAVVYKDELAEMPLDEEVLKADLAAEKLKEVYNNATKWEVLPFAAKGLLLTSTVVMVISCYMVQLLHCFVAYELTSSVSGLDGGQWYNLMTGTGFIAVGLFLVSAVLLYIYQKWAACRASSWPQDGLADAGHSTGV